MVRLRDFRIGDRVLIDSDLEGVVVFNSSAGFWSDEFPESDWPRDNYDGIMIRIGNGGLVFHEARFLDEDDGSIRRLGGLDESS